MYLPHDETEYGVLRQGDVIADVHNLGAIKADKIFYSTQARSEDVQSWTVQTKPSFGEVMVLSHSCELDPDNSVKVTSVILAPIRSLDSASSSANRQQLIDSNIIDPSTSKASFLKYFYLEEHSDLPNVDSVVDFSKMFSVHKTAIPMLIASKKIQLRPDIADAMAFKCSLFFYRQQLDV